MVEGNKKVLVFDDEAVVRSAFLLALEDTGYMVTACADGRQGIEAMASDAYDLIYLDLKMPGMNGVETLKAIRRRNKTVPIYVVTAYYEDFADELDKLRSDNLDFEVMIKPLGRDQIITITKGILDGPIFMT